MGRKRKQRRGVERGASTREVTHPNAAGIDLGSEGSYVAVPADRDAQPVRRFGCYTQDLHELADWLGQCGIDTVAISPIVSTPSIGPNKHLRREEKKRCLHRVGIFQAPMALRNSRMKAGRSGHALLVMRFPSTTTSASS